MVKKYEVTVIVLVGAENKNEATKLVNEDIRKFTRDAFVSGCREHIAVEFLKPELIYINSFWAPCDGSPYLVQVDDVLEDGEVYYHVYNKPDEKYDKDYWSFQVRYYPITGNKREVFKILEAIFDNE